jgi:hypothetical protein
MHISAVYVHCAAQSSTNHESLLSFKTCSYFCTRLLARLLFFFDFCLVLSLCLRLHQPHMHMLCCREFNRQSHGTIRTSTGTWWAFEGSWAQLVENLILRVSLHDVQSFKSCPTSSFWSVHLLSPSCCPCRAAMKCTQWSMEHCCCEGHTYRKGSASDAFKHYASVHSVSGRVN